MQSLYKFWDKLRKCVVPMAGTSLLRLFVVLLCFSHLIFCLNAVPITRIRSLELRSQGYGVSENFHTEKAEESLNVETLIRRMDVELHDYPGSGANNRHTPKPQPGRGCVDC